MNDTNNMDDTNNLDIDVEDSKIVKKKKFELESNIYKDENENEIGELFLKEIRNTSFFKYNVIDVIVNLYFVLREARPAWLFEAQTKEKQDMLKEINNLFGNYLQFTNTSSQNNILIYHKGKEIEPEIHDDDKWDIWLGNVLGFFCPHNVHKSSMDTKRYNITYLANGVGFYAEMCTKKTRELSLDIDKRLKKWESIGQEIGYQITVTISKQLPFNYWYNLIVNKNINYSYNKLLNKKYEFISFIRGYGLFPDKFLRDLGFTNKTVPDEDFVNKLKKYYNWFVMGFVAEKHDSFKILRTFHGNDDTYDIEEEMENAYMESDQSPEEYITLLFGHHENKANQLDYTLNNILNSYSLLVM